MGLFTIVTSCCKQERNSPSMGHPIKANRLVAGSLKGERREFQSSNKKARPSYSLWEACANSSYARILHREVLSVRPRHCRQWSCLRVPETSRSRLHATRSCDRKSNTRQIPSQILRHLLWRTVFEGRWLDVRHPRDGFEWFQPVIERGFVLQKCPVGAKMEFAARVKKTQAGPETCRETSV